MGGGLTSAVHWWEEWQLRVLVLTSLAVQFLLFIFSSFRRYAVPRCVRSMTWLTYLGGDAVAIYALATLFNRHSKDQDAGGRGGSNTAVISTLEVMWAPVLLLHLGGHDGITAYNIEDNELWSRHLVTALSQVTVAIYVFCKSWPSDGDKRLLQAAILLFIPGVVKCFVKPWALKTASIYSLVSSSRATAAGQNEDEDMYPLQEYVTRAKEFLDDQEHGNEHIVDDEAIPVAASMESGGHSPSQGRSSILFFFHQCIHRQRQKRRKRLQQLGKLVDDEGTRTWPPSGEEDKDHQSQGQLFQQVRQLFNEDDQIRKRLLVLGQASEKLFVDLSSPYPLRLRMLKFFWGISQDRAYSYVQGGLVSAFLLLYTKLKTAGFATETEMALKLKIWDLKIQCRMWILLSRVVLPLVSIGLFQSHQSHSEAARKNDIIDVKITYAIFCCTAVLEIFSTFPVFSGDMVSSDDIYHTREPVVKWPEMVAQYSLIGYYATNKKYSNWISIAGIFGCKDFVDQRMLCMNPCSSSAKISRLVLGYLKDGWKKEIHGAPSYRRFNDHSTHWPLFLGYLEGHHVGLSSSMRKRAFDESVLLWHITTDFCYFLSLEASEHTLDSDYCAVRCREMSNYMVYLLFVNPEMLLPGTRRNLFTGAYDGLNHILKDMGMDMDIPMGRKPPNVKKDEWVMQQRVIAAMQKRTRSKKASEPYSDNKEEPKAVSPPEEAESLPSTEKSNKKKKGGRSKGKLIDDAWALAQRLVDNNKGDEKKMWEEIQRVWVEMLCFSASRCRGYLHAKALGEGGEFLSYVWLLLFYMGMETFTDKLHREEPPSVSHEGNDDNAPPPSTAPPSTYCEASTGIAAPSTSKVHAGAGAVPSSSEICMAEDDMV